MKYWTSKMRLSILSVFATLCLLGAGNAALGEETTLRVSYHGPLSIEKLDPYRDRFTFQTLIAVNVFEPLLSHDVDDQLPFRAAQKFQVIDNKIVFTLREGLKWSDGTEVIAQNYIDGLLRSISPSSSQDRLANYIVGADTWRLNGGNGEVEGLRLIDKYTFELEVKHSPEELLADREMAFIPAPSHLNLSLKRPWGAQTLVSNGPYVVTSSSSSEQIILEKNEFYSGPLNPKIDRIVFPSGRLDSAVRNFTSGNIDLVLDVPFKQLGWVNNNISKNFIRSKESGGLYVGVDIRAAPMNDQRVRRALLLASNRKEISNAAFGGAGEPLFGTVPGYVSQAPEIASKLATLSRDEALTLAKENLDKAGFSSNEPLRIRLGYFDILTFRTVAHALRHDWASVGVDVELVKYEKDFSLLMKAAQSGEIDTWIYTYSFAETTPESVLQYVADYVDGNMFYSFYSDSEYNKIISQAFRESGKRRLDLLAQAERRLASEAVSNPIGWYPSGALASDTWIDAVKHEFTNAARLVEFANIQN